jgi:hypothetical protein
MGIPGATTAGLTDTAAEATGFALSTGDLLHATINTAAATVKGAEYLGISAGMILSRAQLATAQPLLADSHIAVTFLATQHSTSCEKTGRRIGATARLSRVGSLSSTTFGTKV